MGLVRTLAILATIGLLGLLGGMGTSRIPVARAHAQLVGTTPAANEQLEAAPTELRLWFSEAVSPAGEAIRLLDATGTAVNLGEVGHAENARTIRALLPESLPDGSYAVVWAVVSEDGHTIRGSFVFSVGQSVDGSLEVPTPASTAAWVTVAATGSRSIAYILALLVIGMLAFVVVPGRAESASRLRKSMLACAAVLLLAIPVVLLAEGLVATTGTFSEIWQGSTWDLLWDGRHTPAALIIAAGAVCSTLVLLAMPRGFGVARPLGIASIGLLGLGFAWSGHPAADSAQWLGIAMDAAHVVSAGAWAGALAILLIERRTMDPSARAGEARRFSRLATVAFPAALASGTYLAWRVLPGLDALIDSNYGRLLVAKVALVVVVAGLASWNRWRLLPRFVAEPDKDRRLFTRFAAMELALVTVVVAITGTLTGQSPFSAAASDSGGPSGILAPPVVDGFVGSYHFVLEVEPAAHGPNTIIVDVHDSLGGNPVGNLQQVEVILNHVATGTGPFSVLLEPTLEGRYEAAGQLFPLGGNWAVTLAVRVSDFRQERITVEIGIR